MSQGGTGNATLASERSLGTLVATVIFNVVVCSAFQEALFLAHHRRSRIPIAMFLGSLVTAATTLGFNRFLRHLPQAAALRAILCSLAALALAMTLWNWTPTPTSSFTLFLFAELATTLGAAATWAYVQAPLDAPQIRKLVPRLGVWGGAGGTVAGALIPILLRKGGQPQLLIGLSALTWIAAALLINPRHEQAARNPRKASSTAGLRQLPGVPLARWMALGTTGIIWMGLLVQYQTRVALQAAFAPTQIAQVMGVLLALASLLGLVIQARVTTPVLERFGVAVALTVLPLCAAALLFPYLLLPAALWLITGAHLMDKTLRPNLHRSAESCLIAALSPTIRPTLLLALGGVITPVMKALGSLALLFFAAVVPPLTVPATALLIGLGLLLLTRRWSALYIRSLSDTLEEGSLDNEDADLRAAALPLIDGPRLRLLLSALEGESPRSRELALEMLRPHRSALVHRAMSARVAHPQLAVRLCALRWLAEEPSPALQETLRQRFQETGLPDEERVAILRAAGPEALALLGADVEAYLASPSLELRLAAIDVLLDADPDQQGTLFHRAVKPCLSAMLRADSPSERRRALDQVRARQLVTLQEDVLRCLQDPDPLVRREALGCLPLWPAARPTIWGALQDPDLTQAAARALAACGESALSEIMAAVTSSETAPAQRLHLIRALGTIPLSEAHARAGQVELALLGLLGGADRPLELEALKALHKLRRRSPGRWPQSDAEAPLRDLLIRDLAWGLGHLQAREVLWSTIRRTDLLARELATKIDDAQQRVYLALALQVSSGALFHAFRALIAPAHVARTQVRAHARELVKTLLPPGPIQAGSLKLFDTNSPWPPEAAQPPLSIREAHTLRDAVRWLWQTGDPWTRTALVHDAECVALVKPLGPLLEDPMEPFLDTVLFLKEVALFEQLTNKQLVEVARLGAPLEVPEGHVLCREGDEADFLYLVRRGKLRVLIGGVEVARLGPGECAGEMAVLTGDPRSATVDALSPCLLLRFDAEDFLALIDSYPEIGRGMLKTLVRRLRRSGQSRADLRSTMFGLIGHNRTTIARRS